MGCDCSCHEKLDKIKVRGCCFKCEKEHDPLRNALQEVGRNCAENGRLRRELGLAADILAGREKANLTLVVHDWEKMLGRFR